jgi:3-dehydroquinate synthase
LREILNFGHTFGHALESTTRYKKFQHGEAIAWGMMCAALLGHETVGTPPDQVSRLVSLIRQIGPLPAWPANISPQKLIAAMRSDKKSRSGKLRFVLSEKFGIASTYDSASEQVVSIVLRVAPKALLNPLHDLGKSKNHTKNLSTPHQRKLPHRPAR